jgi:stage II sporulation protein D
MRKWVSLVTLSALLSTTAVTSAYAGTENKVMNEVKKAYIASVQHEGSALTYQMIVDGEVKTFHTHNKSFNAQPGQFVNFKAKGDRIVDFQAEVAVTALHEKIMAKNTAAKTLDLELTGTVQLDDNYEVFQNIGGQLIEKSLNDVYVGANNVSVFLNEQGKVFQIIIEGQTPVDKMRVGLMNANFASLDHSQFDVKSASGFQIVDKKGGQTFDIAPDTVATFVSTPLGTKVSVGGIDLYTTPNRLYVMPKESMLTVTTFKRAYGYPSYRGYFEITPSATAGKLNVINEVQLEEYLYQVVPSEMPASFGLEALKAQSVAARTYALSDYYSNRYANKGFHVDDSTLSQVYNNSAENALTTQAVNETRGLVMMSGGELVDARYYSTSGGFGAAKHEVWADANGQFPGTPVPYLSAKSYVYDPADPTKMYNLNTQDEAALNAFYKDLSFTGHDSTSYYFRWKVTFTKAELENTINSQLQARYAADPKFILTKDASGNFVSKPIPANGAGEIKNLYVTKRGAGGNMMELVVEGTTGTYKILKEYNIRFIIRPSKQFTLSQSDMLLYRAKGGSTTYDLGYTLKNYSILPSAFATFDIVRDANGAISSVTFYGGGNGHGVGMSQYGASDLGAKGWTFDQILDCYYNGMELKNVYEQ